MTDVIIRGGSVVDGSGKPSLCADVGSVAHWKGVSGAQPPPERRLGWLADYGSAERMALEKRFLEMTAAEHPLAAYRPRFEGLDLVTTRDLASRRGRLVRIAGWLVTTRRVSTSKGEMMLFAMMEDEFGTVETTLFPRIYRKYGHLFATHGPYLVAGVVDDDHGSVTVTVRDVGLLKESP